jgi:Dehydrogenases with different specificities (related to short-chain alcohol dehydrogenases)
MIPGWESAASENFAGLRLDPWRLRVMPGSVMLAGSGETLVWVDYYDLGGFLLGMHTVLFDFTGPVALLTGASQGMGQSMAMALAGPGSLVVVSSR